MNEKGYKPMRFIVIRGNVATCFDELTVRARNYADVIVKFDEVGSAEVIKNRYGSQSVECDEMGEPLFKLDGVISGKGIYDTNIMLVSSLGAIQHLIKDYWARGYSIDSLTISTFVRPGK